jgi:hypothetical protein
VTGQAIGDLVGRREAQLEVHAAIGMTPGPSWHSACAGPVELDLLKWARSVRGDSAALARRVLQAE